MNMDLDPHHRSALSVENAVRRSGFTRWLASASAFFFTTIYSPVVSFSQVHDHHSTVEVSPEPLTDDVKNELTALTQTLLTHNAQSLGTFNVQSRMSVSAAQSVSAVDLVAVAEARQQLLSSLIEEHPEEVLRNAIPADVRATFPSAVQAYVEEEAEQEGELEIIYEMYDDWQKARLHYTLKKDNKELSLHFAAKQPKHLLTGSQVRVKGVQVGEALALASGNTNVQALSAALPNTLGEQRVLVMLVNFQDNPQKQPFTIDFARAEVFSKTDRFFRENSYGQTWLTGDVFGWYTIPLDSTVCNYSQLATLARQAATNAGFDVSSYDRYVYGFPRNACNWSGLATLGGSNAWINGGFSQTTISHELGHTLGLYHSHAYECGSTTLGTSCATLEYADYFDTMGFGPGHYNAFQKERLGWWLPEATHTVQSNGEYVLDLYETLPGSKPKILKIQKAPGQWYYVEYRQPVGFDGFLLSNDNVRNGVLIHKGTESSGNSSYLLDMTPETNSWYDPALEVDQSFIDADAGITIRPLWVNNTGAAVSVSLTAQPCLHTAPSVTLSPTLSPAVSAGATVSYTVSITNNDGPQCTSSSFTLQTNAPTTDWIAVLSNPILTLGPGASTSTTLTVTSPFSASEGAYEISVAAARSGVPGNEAMGSVTYTIAPPSTSGDVSVTTDKPSYIAREWVKTTASVRRSGSPVYRAKVSFIVTGPGGYTRKRTMATNKQGEAMFQFQLSNRDPIGIYRVTVQVSQDGEGMIGFSTTSAEASFTVR